MRRLIAWWTSEERWWSYARNRAFYDELDDYYREQR